MQIHINAENIHTVIDKYSSLVLNVALQNTRDNFAAEDIYQDVFIKLIEKSISFESEEHLRAWLIRVTINESNNFFRSSFRRLTVPLLDNAVVYSYFASDDHKMLFDEIKKLRKNYRNVLYLYYYEEYTMEEIAEILGRKQNTINTWLRRARSELKKNMKGEYSE